MLSSNTNFKEFWVKWICWQIDVNFFPNLLQDFLLRFSRIIVLFLFLFLLFYFRCFLSLTFLQDADRYQVAIGIYPRGCVDRLLWFIISLYLFLLGTIFYGFCAFPRSGITVAFLSFLAMIGDGGADPALWARCLPHPEGYTGCTWTLSTIDYTELSDSGLTVLLVLSLRLSFYSPKRDLFLPESIY